MVRRAPPPAQPDSGFPAGLVDDVGLLAAVLTPENALAELQMLLAAFLAEETLVGRLAVEIHHVLGQDVSHELDQPGNRGVLNGDVRVDLFSKAIKCTRKRPLKILTPFSIDPLDS